MPPAFVLSQDQTLKLTVSDALTPENSSPITSTTSISVRLRADILFQHAAACASLPIHNAKEQPARTCAPPCARVARRRGVPYTPVPWRLSNPFWNRPEAMTGPCQRPLFALPRRGSRRPPARGVGFAAGHGSRGPPVSPNIRRARAKVQLRRPWVVSQFEPRPEKSL